MYEYWLERSKALLGDVWSRLVCHRLVNLRTFTWTWGWPRFSCFDVMQCQTCFCLFFPPDFGAFRPVCMDSKQKKKIFHAGNDRLPFNQRLHFVSIDRLIFFWGLPSALLEKRGYKLDGRSNKIHNKSHFLTSAESSSTLLSCVLLSLKSTVH